MEIITEKQTEKHVTCPCCDGEIKWIKQFPFAEITGFQRLQLPDLIEGPVEDILPVYLTKKRFFRNSSIQNPQIPEEVMQRLAQSNRFSYQGIIYEKVTKIKRSREVMEDWLKSDPDMTRDEIKKIFGRNEWEEGVRIYRDLTREVNQFLAYSKAKETLETLERFVGTTVSTKDIFNLHYINQNEYPTVFGEFNLRIEEKNFGECVLGVDSARSSADIHLGCGPGAYMIGFELDVAKFTYNGLFR